MAAKVVTRLNDWIKRHQVTAFFIVTFSISWGLGFAYSAVLKRNQFLLLPIFFAATCGPALAGIIISVVNNTQPKVGTHKAFWIIFCIALIVSAVVFIANSTVIEHVPLSVPLLGLVLVAAVPVAFIISAMYLRIPEVRSYLASLLRLRIVWGWALLALVGMPATILLSVPISSLLSGRPISTYRFPDTSLALIGQIPIKLIYQLFFFNATGEEAGWRGFALPRLQFRTSPLIAATIIGVLWTVWHFLGWQAEGRPVNTAEFWLEMFAGHILFSVMIVWIYNRAKGSILVAGITHAAGNAAQAFIPHPIEGVLLGWSAIVLVLILVDRMWKNLATDHPAVYRRP